MNPELAKKSLTDLRVMAQAFGVTDIFEKDDVQLRQAIELKQEAMIPAPVIIPERSQYDARLMTKIPNAQGDMTEITELLRPFIERGLKLKFDEESWYMDCGKKTDTGSKRMPLRDILRCAEKVFA